MFHNVNMRDYKGLRTLVLFVVTDLNNKVIDFIIKDTTFHVDDVNWLLNNGYSPKNALLIFGGYVNEY